MNDGFELLYPPRIVFGSGACDRIPDLVRDITGVPQTRTLVVCCRHVDTPEFHRRLAGDGKIRIVAVVSGIPREPPPSCVDDIAAQIRRAGAACVVAIGGGSVIDAAKAAACLAPVPGAMAAAYFLGEKMVSSPGLPLIAVPTTAGTGAEITRNSVLTDPGSAVKQSVRSPFMVPAAAVVDPALTLSCPPELTAGSGLDALTQAIESFLSLRANAVSRALARDAVQRLVEHLPQAFRDGGDLAARTCVAEGSLLSGMAFSQSGLGAVHGLAHPLGALLAIPHGLTCAILLPHVLRWNLPVCRDLLEALGQAAGGAPDAEAFATRIERLCHELGVPRNFSAYGLRDEHLPHIVANCRSGSMKTTPRPLSDSAVVEFLRKLQ